jgi:hypothetical protein
LPPVGGGGGKLFLPFWNMFLTRQNLTLFTHKNIDRVLGAKYLEKLPQTQLIKLHKISLNKTPLKTPNFRVQLCSATAAVKTKRIKYFFLFSPLHDFHGQGLSNKKKTRAL